MKALAVDTATETLALCASDGPNRVSLALRRGLQHSPALLPLADRLLEQLGIRPDDLELLVCSLGPGSFTGIRIGVATVKGIAFAAGCPVVGISTLEVLAAPWTPFEGDVWPVIDARKGNWYAARYQGGRRETAWLDVPPQELRRLIEARQQRTLLVGPDAGRLRALVFAEPHAAGPAVSTLLDPSSVLEVGLARYQAVGATGDLSPLYLRPSEAERERAAGGSDGG